MEGFERGSHGATVPAHLIPIRQRLPRRSPSARRRSLGESGAESLEFLGLLPLLTLVILLGWQGLATLRQYGEAQADAQVMARTAAICGATPISLRTVDTNAGAGATASVTDKGDYVTASVVLQPYSVFSQINLHGLGFPAPSSRVVMRHEPC